MKILRMLMVGGALLGVAGCQEAGAAAAPEPTAALEDQLGAAKDLFVELEGSWFGEVANVYRACFTFSKVRADTPWQAQTVVYRIAEGGPTTVGTLALSRFPPTQGGPTLNVFTVSPPSAGAEAVFAPGVYLQGPVAPTKRLSFWRHEKTDLAQEQVVSASGLEFVLERSALRVAAFGSDVYCTSGDQTAPCGSGGYRPFVVKRVKDCPQF